MQQNIPLLARRVHPFAPTTSGIWPVWSQVKRPFAWQHSTLKRCSQADSHSAACCHCFMMRITDSLVDLKLAEEKTLGNSLGSGISFLVPLPKAAQ